jgi:nucleoside-diphosphate-sugar epimerase
VAVFGKGNTRRRWVSTDDVAALIALVVVEPTPPSLIEFGGPEAMRRNETITVAEQLMGRKMNRLRARVGRGLQLRQVLTGSSFADPSPDKNAHPSRQVRAFRCGVAE